MHHSAARVPQRREFCSAVDALRALFSTSDPASGKRNPYRALVNEQPRPFNPSLSSRKPQSQRVQPDPYSTGGPLRVTSHLVSTTPHFVMITVYLGATAAVTIFLLYQLPKILGRSPSKGKAMKISEVCSSVAGQTSLMGWG
jgi:hypothetical protein